MKLGLSTWSLLHLDVDSAVRAVGDAGFDYVELWGEVPHAYPDWVDGKRLKDTLSAYDMALTMHAPFTDLNPASPFQPVKGSVERTLEGFVRFGASLGATMVTVHPGSVHNEALVPQSTQSSIATLRAMVKASDGRLTINVENQTKSRSMYHFPLASTMESLELILADVDGARCTLDTGHAHANGQSPLAMAERVGTKLSEIHLNDNEGASDDHLVPGQGTADLSGLLDKFKQTDGFLCLELDPHRYTVDEVLAAASEIKIRLAGGSAGGT